MTGYLLMLVFNNTTNLIEWMEYNGYDEHEIDNLKKFRQKCLDIAEILDLGIDQQEEIKNDEGLIRRNLQDLANLINWMRRFDYEQDNIEIKEFREMCSNTANFLSGCLKSKKAARNRDLYEHFLYVKTYAGLSEKEIAIIEEKVFLTTRMVKNMVVRLKEMTLAGNDFQQLCRFLDFWKSEHFDDLILARNVNFRDFCEIYDRLNKENKND